MSPSLFPLGGFSVFFLLLCVYGWRLICFRMCVNSLVFEPDGSIYMHISYSFGWECLSFLWPIIWIHPSSNVPMFWRAYFSQPFSGSYSCCPWWILMVLFCFRFSLSFHRWRATRSRMSFCFSLVLLWTFLVSEGLYERVLVPLSEATRWSRFIAPSMWIQ